MRIRTTTRRVVSVAATAGLAVGVIGVGTTQAENPQYVALGDSFSAGTGAGDSTHPDCYRSPHGYPAVIAGTQGLNLDYRACSGADTADVLGSQLGSLSPDTAYVTITIGGNDLNFAGVITDCALPGWLANCLGSIEDSRQIMQTELPGRLDQVYGSIASGAPQADVRVGGYPLLFNGQDCHALTFFSATEMAELNAATHELNALTEQRTGAAGFTYVDPVPSFLGHAVCDADPWINNLSLRIEDSFHPNVAGNAGYAEVFWPGSTAAAVVPTTAPTQAPSLTAQAALVRNMQLTSPENLALAAAAGIDTDELLALEADLSSPDAAVVAAALERLAELDREHEARSIG